VRIFHLVKFKKNFKLSEFLRNNTIFQVAHLKYDPASKTFNTSKTKAKLLYMKKERKRKPKH
jgi:hypothetical protein|tara:strand:+ start:1447 stop:1632 length:186 start_codon:yes stop_codon:yes gene_type:complete